MTKCIACGGKGLASRGGPCVPCKGTGQAADPVPRTTAAMKTAVHQPTPESKRGRVKVLCGDCRDWIPKAARKVGRFHLVFADPPFNIGQPYADHQDSMAWADYLDFTKAWVELCWLALRPGGYLCLHGPDRVVDAYMAAAAALGFASRRAHWIIWHYRFGQNQRSHWPNAHCHLLVYAQRGENTWNPDAVLVPSDRAAVYGDQRTQDSATPGLRLPGTVWGVPSDGAYWGRVPGNSSERWSLGGGQWADQDPQGPPHPDGPQCHHPNQLPERYLERVLRAYTNPGDVVLDPFAGTGTTAVVAQALGRDCVTVDVSEAGCRSVRNRCKVGAVRL